MLYRVFVFFFKQKTAYEMRISDWSSDVCSSDLVEHDDVVLVLGGVPESVDAVMGHVDRTTFGLEPPAQAVGEPYFVIDHENAHRPSMNEIGRASCRERVCQYV